MGREGELGAIHGEAIAAAWNKRVPSGSAVTLINDLGQEEETTTRSEAWALGDGEPVVKVAGRSGCYLLSRIVPHVKEAQS